MDFGNRLKQYRKIRKMNQADLAAALEVGRTTITKWEAGENTPSIEVLNRLSDLLEVSADDLLGRKPIIDKYKRDSKNEKLLKYYSKLNDLGQNEAVKRVAELTINPLFRDMPIAAHNDHVIDKNELELMRQDIEEL